MQMLAISERDNKIIMMNMTKDLVEKVNNMNEKIKNFSREAETIQKVKRKC